MKKRAVVAPIAREPATTAAVEETPMDQPSKHKLEARLKYTHEYPHEGHGDTSTYTLPVIQRTDKINK